MNYLQQDFTAPLLHWFDQHGRKNLPWQHPGTPYQVWLSEIMLQQTQVTTVIPYFQRFMQHFPTVHDLAQANEDQVLALWAGLGYYSRARSLHRTAQIITDEYHGEWPRTLDKLMALPGIGPSTAAAITAQAFHQATPILDGNVKRVLCRYFMVEGIPDEAQNKKKLWALAQTCMSTTRCKDYTQAIMDLGATCCTNRQPQCTSCPLMHTCTAFLVGRVREFPYKKIKKTIPTRSTQLLLIQNEAKQIYLEKNPPKGIWGSLWCLPMLELIEDPIDYLNAWGQRDVDTRRVVLVEEFMAFKHTFTHFHLEIKAMLVQIASTSTCIRPLSTGHWFSEKDLQKVGLPKPVQTIVQALYTEKVDL